MGLLVRAMTVSYLSAWAPWSVLQHRRYPLLHRAFRSSESVVIPGLGNVPGRRDLWAIPVAPPFLLGRLVRLPLTRISCGLRPGRSRYLPTLVRLQIAGQLPVWGGGGAGLFPCSEQMRIAEWKSGWVAREA